MSALGVLGAGRPSTLTIFLTRQEDQLGDHRRRDSNRNHKQTRNMLPQSVPDYQSVLLFAKSVRRIQPPNITFLQRNVPSNIFTFAPQAYAEEKGVSRRRIYRSELLFPLQSSSMIEERRVNKGLFQFMEEKGTRARAR